MNSLATSDFRFQGVELHPVERSGNLWFSSSDLAKALGYKKTDAVTQIYSRYSDEFAANMSTTLRERVVRKTGAVEMVVRFFSLRGAHLIAMFASTPKAKEFRRWVLDILDRQIEQLPLPASNHLITNLELICRTWDEAKEQIADFDPKMAKHLNGTMNMFWVYTMSMKKSKGGVKNKQRYLQ